MARGKYVTEFERDCIRIGKAYGIQDATIARAIKRSRVSVGEQVKRMQEDGTIDNLPMIFMQEEVAEMLKREGAIK